MMLFSLTGLSACWGTCAAICAHPLTLTFLDAAGTPVSAVSGTLSSPGGSSLDFNCDTGLLVDGGAASGTCGSNTVTVSWYTFNTRAIAVVVTTPNGRAFSGEITPSSVVSGGEICGSRCMTSSATVVLK